MQPTARAAFAAALIAVATGAAAQEQAPAPPPAPTSCNAFCQLVRGIGGDRNPPGSSQAAAPPQATGQPLALETADPKANRRGASVAQRRANASRATATAHNGSAATTGVGGLSTSAVQDRPFGDAPAETVAVEGGGAKTSPSRDGATGSRLGVLMGPDEALAPVLSDLAGALEPKLKVEAVRGKAPPLRDLLSLPNVDMAVVSSPMLASAGPAAAKLVYVAKLFGEELHVIARPDIQSLDDLSGKAVYLGAPGGDSELVSKTVLEKRGVSVTAAGGTLSDALAQLRDGRIAAVMTLAPKPFAPIADLGGAGGLHLLSVSFNQLGEGYDPAFFSHADYPGLVRDGDRIETAAVDAILVAPWWRESSPRQQELASGSKTLFERFPELLKQGHHPKWKETNLAAVVDGKRRLKAADQWVQAQIKVRRAASAAQ